MFHGSIVALVTPMHSSGEIDFTSLSQLIEWHIESGTDALVVLGSTGEAATITENERSAIIRHVVEQAGERIPVIAGTGSNSTQHTIELTKAAMSLGVDACLIVTPYYNRPTQEGLYQHFTAVAQAVPIPQILYNVPGRTGCDLLPETAARLAKIPNIVGYKEATGKLERVPVLLDLCGDRLDLYSGDDPTAAEFILLGGKGDISITANVAPRLMHEMCTAALQKDTEKTHEINAQLDALHHAVCIEPNPIPVKWILHKMGRIPNGIRLPLTPLSSQYYDTVTGAMQKANIIS